MLNVQQLVENNINLVYFVINKHYPTFRQDEDIIQCGKLGLCQAANTWDDEKGAFSTYATRCIINEIIDEFNKRKKHTGTLSLDYETNESEGETKRFGDIIVGDEDVDCVGMTYKWVYEKLTPFEKQILKMLSTGMSKEEIASQLGVNKVAVLKRIRKIKKLWRKTNDC